MQVDQVIETSDGKYVVQSKFSPTEMAVVVEAGLRALLQKGALPLTAEVVNGERQYRAYPPSHARRSQVENSNP